MRMIEKLVSITSQRMAIEQVNGYAVRRFVRGSSNVGDSPIRREDKNGRQFVLQGTVEERKTLDIQHVNLVDEKDSRDDIGLTLAAPLGDL
eukprot:1357417-Amorphochlora_amoeboformis.AAC.3